MTRPIGYYVHHQGDGHRQRALAIAAAMPGRVTLIGTGLAGKTGEVPCVDLPDDRIGEGFDGDDGAATRPEALHYAPIDHDGVRRRVAAIAGWIAVARPALMIVDVSCEIAMLARLASVPTIVVRLNGLRDDAAHLEAFRGSVAIVAPFAAALDDPAMPAWVRAKTWYAPGLIRRSTQAAVDVAGALVVLGGGGEHDGAVWARAAAAQPDLDWNVIGPCVPVGAMPNLRWHGWVGDAEDRIARAGVVIGGAGNGLIGAVLAARRPFVCVPEERAFGEQRANARALARAGAAILCDDAATADWPALIDAALALDPAACAALDDRDGAATLAQRLLAA